MRVSQAELGFTSDEEGWFSIPDASARMGVDCFIVYGLIQRDELQAKRAPWGEFGITQSQLNRVLQPVAVQSNDRVNEEPIC